jgi:F420-non-reducing hydrogenase small subunit
MSLRAPIATGPKPKLAIYGAASCGGCDIAMINVHEHILEIAAAFEIVLWPTVMDGKYADIAAFPDKAITLTLISGGVRTTENAELVHLLRAKSQILVALGSCAQEGCIPGLANLSSRRQILDTAFSTDSADNPDGLRPIYDYHAPEGDLDLPAFEPVLRTLSQVVSVDYTIPGCPPESEQVWAALTVLMGALSGTGPTPPPGNLGAGVSTVCDQCPRARNVKKIDHFVRIQEVLHFEDALCLLEQGLPCNGPATSDGCGALCPRVGAACIGCYGPAAGVSDYGARLLSAFASVIDANDPAAIERILDGLPDPVGQFYRFGLAGSTLRASRAAWASEDTSSETES